MILILAKSLFFSPKALINFIRKLKIKNCTIMKKSAWISCIVLISGLVMTTSLNAQSSTAILRGGINFANVSTDNNGGYDDAKMLTSFQVGVIGDFNLTKYFAIQPGLLFTGKGT